MSFYIVSESRLLADRVDQYLEAIRQVVQVWASAAGSYTHSVYLGRDDPTLALTVGRWRHPSDRTGALAERVAPLAGAVNACVAASLSDEVWYQTAREAEQIGLRSMVATATRLRVEPAIVPDFLERDRLVQDAVKSLPGVVAVRLLAGLSTPGEFMLLNEYVDEAAHAVAARTALDVAAPIPFTQFRRFRGSLGWHWERSAEQIRAGG